MTWVRLDDGTLVFGLGEGAVRCDPRVRGDGPAALVVWQRLEQGPLYDDPAVQELTRRLAEGDRSGRVADLVSTFTRDPRHYVGGMTVHREGVGEDLLRDSWLRVLGPVELVRVPAGVLALRVVLAGPGTQRYAGKPWPAEGF
jgi:hypothetical protein